jgi:hypothetical protein
MDFKAFFNKLYVESVSFSVADHEEEVATLGDLSNKLSQQFWKFIKQNGFTDETIPSELQGYDNVIAVDGDSDYFGKEGIINVYTHHIPEELQQKTLKMIAYYIDEFNASLVSKPWIETSGSRKTDVWRFNVKVNDVHNAPPELNLSNTNARAILVDVLNYPSEILEEYPSLSAKELLMKIEQIEDNDWQIGKGERKEEQDGNHYMFGLSVEQIKERLVQLKKLCEWAVENNFTYIALS